MGNGVPAARRRLVGLLARRGYSAEIVAQVVDEALADYGAETRPDGRLSAADARSLAERLPCTGRVDLASAPDHVPERCAQSAVRSSGRLPVDGGSGSA